MKQIYKIFKGVFTVILLVSTSANSQNKFFKKLENEKVASTNGVVWKQVAPGNAGFANLMRYHPTIPELITQCPDMWNAYQSENNGKSWYGITDYDGDASFYHLRDLEYSVTDAKFGLALTSSQLWKTKDLGKNWEIVKYCPWYKVDNDGTDKESWRRKVAAVTIDPTNEKVWYVAGGGNVRQQDWMSSLKDINAKNPRGDESKKFMHIGKLWKTSNGGKSWKLINNGLPEQIQVCRIIVNPRKPKQIFAASNYGLFQSENGGKKWKKVSGQFDNDIIMDMDFYYNAKTKSFQLFVIDQTQYVANGKTTQCTGGVFYSNDEGKSWKNITGELYLDINQLSGGVPANYYLYLAKWFGISKGKAQELYPELPTKALQRFNMISADPSKEGVVYLGFADPQIGKSIMPGRLWKTEDFGNKWISTARLYQETWEKDKAYWEKRGNPTHNNMEVGHSSPHMRFGKNYALRSMRGMDVGVDGSVMIISDHSTMLSSDRGATWKQVDENVTSTGAIIGTGNSNLPALTIAQDKRFETTLLGSGEHRLWIPEITESGEIALKYIESAQATVSNIVFDPYDAKTVYVTSNRQEEKQYMFRSTDGGLTWHKHGIATPATNKWKDDFYTNGLLIDPIDPNYMYFGITDIANAKKGHQGGFFVSKDKGKTFQQSNEGLPSPAKINDVQFDPRDLSRKSLFIAAEKNIHNYRKPLSEGGLFHSTDRGATWKEVKTPSEVEGVQFVTFDHTNRMYITTGYRGGGAGVWYSDDFGENWEQVFKAPETECFAISPFDHNLMVVTTKFLSKNPGVYLSKDRGETWEKINKSIVIPHQIEDVKFDLHNPAEMWLATKGGGFYKGKIENGNQVQVVKVTTPVVTIKDGKKIQLKAKIVNKSYQSEKIVWKSENSAIAKVSKTGTITPVGKGNVKIWATTKDGRFGDYSVVTVH
ncbi:VPS10 domain-containing protein [Wenyingzhuangia sp. 2_MG-2023]|uniref:VPS10 domain-containing protein n=1 Tax=Wenyingzhuangia sp. 2_MG-2023 TaxID=3062639 RepID=UPI0026E3AE2F|nr:Ig-like domain-containing protein [Wenyingzhuangia sp. 2_MG-2023]MDO6737787.1 Ig-like domain-containing protein [Wenyingzhuangia sp. 2_MG-2023]